MLFANLTIRLLASGHFRPGPSTNLAQLTAPRRTAASTSRSTNPLPLERISEAHDRVDPGARVA